MWQVFIYSVKWSRESGEDLWVARDGASRGSTS